MCLTETPRYKPRLSAPIDMEAHRPEVRFVCHIGDLDLWKYGDEKSWWIVCAEKRCVKPPGYFGPRPNYTGVGVEDGALVFTDKDVVPTPYEMCLLYQALEAHNGT